MEVEKVDLLVSYRVGKYYGDRRSIAPAACDQEYVAPNWGQLGPGESAERNIALDEGANEGLTYLSNSEDSGVTNPALVGYLQIVGTIRHKDRLGISRATGIHRILGLASKRTFEVRESEFEYED